MRPAIPPLAIVALALSAVIGLGVSYEWRSHQQKLFTTNTQTHLTELNAEVRAAFESGFFYYYEEKFLPRVQELLSEYHAQSQSGSHNPLLATLFGKWYQSQNTLQFFILTSSGKIRFSPLSPQQLDQKTNDATLESFGNQSLLNLLKNSDSTQLVTFLENRTFTIAFPTKDHWFVYQESLPPFDLFALVGLFIYLGFLIGIGIFLSSKSGAKFIGLCQKAFRCLFKQLFTLRVQILLSITLVYLATGLFIYSTFTRFHAKEETQRLDRLSLQFSQITTDKIISDYTNFFYFSYRDRFLPAIRSLISSNENLLNITLLGFQNGKVVFNSRDLNEKILPIQDTTDEIIEVPQNILDLLKANSIAFVKDSNAQPIRLTVYTFFSGNTPETSFILRYDFHYATLAKTLQNLRNRLLSDLFFSLLFGLAIALLLAHFISRPIKKLAKGLSQVSLGDYGVFIESRRLDEIGELTKAFNLMTNELRKREELRKFVSRSSYQQIVSANENPSIEGQTHSLNGRRVHAAILFCDIRDFVSHCEKLEAEEITHLLNLYFSQMVSVVERNGGEVDKFIGDALLAVFYSESSETQKHTAALSALQCALEMKDSLKVFNQRRLNHGGRPIEIGVGISYGEVISGPIGSADRMDFTVIGDVVNLAARIEKMSKKGKYTRIVFTEELRRMVEGLVLCDPLPQTEIRGKEESISVYELIAIKELSQLITLTQSKLTTEILRGLQILGFTGHPAAIPPLLEFLSHPEEEVRLQAVLSLAKLCPVIPSLSSSGEITQDGLVHTLFERLHLDTSEKVQSALIKTLGTFCNDEKLLEIDSFLQNKDPRLVANTIEALGKIKSGKALDRIAPLLNSTHHRIKANAAVAFFQGGRFDVIHLIKPLLLQSEPLMRASACYAIGELGRTSLYQELSGATEIPQSDSQGLKIFLSELHSCVPLLVSLLKDTDLRVVRQAVSALGKLQDRSAMLSLMDLVPDYLENAQRSSNAKDILLEILYSLRILGAHRFVRDLISRSPHLH